MIVLSFCPTANTFGKEGFRAPVERGHEGTGTEKTEWCMRGGKDFWVQAFEFSIDTPLRRLLTTSTPSQQLFTSFSIPGSNFPRFRNCQTLYLQIELIPTQHPAIGHRIQHQGLQVINTIRGGHDVALSPKALSASESVLQTFMRLKQTISHRHCGVNCGLT